MDHLTESAFKIRVIVCALALLSFFPAAARDRIVIAAPGFDHPIAIVLKTILPEAYAKIGLDAEFRILPPARARKEFLDGDVDAFIFTDDAFVEDPASAIRIPLEILADDIAAFKKNRNISISGWNDLRPYSIGYMVGMGQIERSLKSGYRTFPAQNPAQAFRMLDAGRVDVVVMPVGVGLMAIGQLGLDDIDIAYPSLTKVPLYHYVTLRNKAVAEKLGAAFAEMIKSGRLKAVADGVFSSFRK